MTLDARELARRQFAEDLSLVWEMAGMPRMDGRVLGYLLMTDRPFLSSAELAEALHASAGAISMATRRLIDQRFIRRHALPGDRRSYFIAEDDPWGSMLTHEHGLLYREVETIDGALAALGPDDHAARLRLTNGRDYLRWVSQYHRRMVADWEAHKAERDAGGPA